MEMVQPANEWKRNIGIMFRTTAFAMILTALTGVVTSLIDGILTSRFLGEGIYSGISLLKPFTSIVMLLSGFLATGCNVFCSRLVGSGKKEEANNAFNLSVFITVILGLALLAACILIPNGILTVSGVKTDKYPELTVHMHDYLRGVRIGIPLLMVAKIMAPILVMDNGKKLFATASATLCVVNIIGDLLNIFVFHGGAYGMGLSTSIAYAVHILMLLPHFFRKNAYYKLDISRIRFGCMRDLLKNGTPDFVKKLAGTLRDVLVNYLNIAVALSAAAIAARGIQSDLMLFLFCISSGLGDTMLSMVGVYYSANDKVGLTRLFSYGLLLGVTLSLAAGLLAFLFAPLLVGIYTQDPETASLAVFSLRWMSVALVFDTTSVIVQHYFEGIGALKNASIMSVLERFILPVASAFVLGMIFGTRGILASVAVSKFLLVAIVFVAGCIANKGFPKQWSEIMFLPKDFGGGDENNMYEEIIREDQIPDVSLRAEKFCLALGVEEKKARYLALFVEELAENVFEHAATKNIKKVRIDLRLLIHETIPYVSMTDLSEQFDPKMFYEMHKNDSPEKHIGIRMVMRMATEVRYFSTFGSNNLVVYLE